MQDEVQNEVTVIKSCSCLSVSGKSTITYEFGMGSDGDQLLFRIKANSGGGMFGKDWVPVQAVIQVLKGEANQVEIKAIAFGPLFAGKSINTRSFLLAAMKNEEVVVPHTTKPRGYQLCDVGAFEERMTALIGGVAVDSTQGAGAVGETHKRTVLKLKKKGAARETN